MIDGEGLAERFRQPAEVPDLDLLEEHTWLTDGIPFTAEERDQLAGLTLEELQTVLVGLPADVRLQTVRDLHDRRTAERAEREFEEEVERYRERKKARAEGERRDAEERDAYLTSTEGRSEAAERFAQQIIDLDELEDPEPIIEGFLHRDTLVRTFGPPKTLKSFVTLDMAASVSLGIEWQGYATVQTNVLYVVAEGARGVKKRRAAWNEHHGTEMKVIFFPKAVQIGDQQQMYDLIAFCLARDIGYVIFDTQARCTVGVDENDNTEMGQIVAALDILKQQTGACVHLVHHAVGSDPKKARGATAWDGAVDAEFYTKRNDKERDLVELVTKFQKDVGEAEPVSMAALEVAGSLVLERTGGGETGGRPVDVSPALVSEAQEVYLEAVREMHGPCTRTDVHRQLKEAGSERSMTAVKKNVNTLIANGALEESGRGSLRVTQGGLVYLDQRRKQGVREGVRATLWDTQQDTQGAQMDTPSDLRRQP